MTIKKTKKDFFKELLEMESVSANTEMVDFINHEIELLDKKKSSKGLTENQKENENLKEVIVATLTDLAKAVTITELQGANEKLAELSNQKISALLKKLVDEGTINKSFDKRKAYFGM